MLIQLQGKLTTQLATGNLIREGVKYPFRYESLPESRKYTIHNPRDGFATLKANISIKTNENLNFVNGDLIKLEDYETTLRVVNITKKVNEKQYMYLKSATSAEYILDLE